MTKFSFHDMASKLRSTPKGKEASMYGPIRDIFIHVFGYPAVDVDIDTAGEGGRPDVTIRAPSGLKDKRGREAKIDWIVVEAKDEHDCFTHPVSRGNIFEKKSKYVGPHTAGFVMIEPRAWILRPVAGNELTPDADVTILIEEGNERAFREQFEALMADKAGVSLRLAKFREGDPRMIAVECLSANGRALSKRAENRIRLNKKRFFQQIREATAHLQSATSESFARLEKEIAAHQASANEFWNRFGKRDDRVVGRCLGLADDDLREIRNDLREDAFLRGIRPRYPGTVTRKQGFQTGLDSGERYE
jgi:hypothetical protein